MKIDMRNKIDVTSMYNFHHEECPDIYYEIGEKRLMRMKYESLQFSLLDHSPIDPKMVITETIAGVRIVIMEEDCYRLITEFKSTGIKVAKDALSGAVTVTRGEAAIYISVEKSITFKDEDKN